MTDYPERDYDDRVIEGVFDSRPGNTTDECQHPNPSFDRSICCCGSMHYYCEDCGAQVDACDDTQTEGEKEAPLSREAVTPGERPQVDAGATQPDSSGPSPSVCVTGLRGLARKCKQVALVVDTNWATEDEKRLIALAPELALWAADAADALATWKGLNHGFTRRGKPRKGCNLNKIHGCLPCRLLARFAVIQARAQEGTP